MHRRRGSASAALSLAVGAALGPLIAGDVVTAPAGAILALGYIVLGVRIAMLALRAVRASPLRL